MYQLKTSILVLALGFILAGCNNDKKFSRAETLLSNSEESVLEIPIEIDEEIEERVEETPEHIPTAKKEEKECKKDKKGPRNSRRSNHRHANRHKRFSNGCTIAQLSDIKLYIKGLMLKDEHGDFELIDIEDQKDIIGLKQGIAFKSPLDGNFDQMYVAVDLSKSSVSTSRGGIFKLKTPKINHRIIKLEKQKNISLLNGQSYNLQLDVSPEDNLVQNNAHCFLKPVVNNSELQEE